MFKKDVVKLAILSIAAAALLSSVCFAADEPKAPEQPKPDVVKVQGIVHVTRDANDVITKVTLAAETEVYNVVLDAKGLELGKTMKGKKVEVEGVVSKKNNQTWITVQSYKPAEEAPKP
jgi:hypothetical protein